MENAMEEAPRRRSRPPLGLDGNPIEATESPAPRVEVSVEDSKARAARRAAELRGHLGGLEEGTDDFYIDPGMVPDGWTYEWKRHLLLGAEDPSYNVALARAGWEAVPVTRDKDHRAMMPMNWSGAHIERKGMILMERPTEIVDEARRIQDRAARAQVRAKEAQLAGTPDGTLTRDHERVRPSIKKAWTAMPVPEE